MAFVAPVRRRKTLAITLALLGAAAACETPKLPSATIEKEQPHPSNHEIEAGAIRIPAWYLASALSPPERSVPSLEQAEALLAQPNQEPIALALSFAGWSAEESAAFVALAAADGSGQPHDPMRARAELAQLTFDAALARLESAVRALEDETKESIDRRALLEAIWPGAELRP